jgi:hypothetical protein
MAATNLLLHDLFLYIIILYLNKSFVLYLKQDIKQHTLIYMPQLPIILSWTCHFIMAGYQYFYKWERNMSIKLWNWGIFLSWLFKDTVSIGTIYCQMHVFFKWYNWRLWIFRSHSSFMIELILPFEKSLPTQVIKENEVKAPELLTLCLIHFAYLELVCGV